MAEVDEHRLIVREVVMHIAMPGGDSRPELRDVTPPHLERTITVVRDTVVSTTVVDPPVEVPINVVCSTRRFVYPFRRLMAHQFFDVMRLSMMVTLLA
ncbi:hypothetical protein ACFQ9X_10020 [Catenulispora yoronensis]